jgi:hypothetical protein
MLAGIGDSFDAEQRVRNSAAKQKAEDVPLPCFSCNMQGFMRMILKDVFRVSG